MNYIVSPPLSRRTGHKLTGAGSQKCLKTEQKSVCVCVFAQLHWNIFHVQVWGQRLTPPPTIKRGGGGGGGG